MSDRCGRLLVPCLLACIAGAGAQPPEPAERDAAGGEQAAAATGDPRSPAVEDGDDTREQTQDSPFDYQASEEISEDLSVSFPVDI